MSSDVINHYLAYQGCGEYRHIEIQPTAAAVAGRKKAVRIVSTAIFALSRADCSAITSPLPLSASAKLAEHCRISFSAPSEG